MDECREMGPVCGNGTCSNVIGGFECDCRNGFTAGPSQTCEGNTYASNVSNFFLLSRILFYFRLYAYNIHFFFFMFQYNMVAGYVKHSVKVIE